MGFYLYVSPFLLFSRWGGPFALNFPGPATGVTGVGPCRGFPLPGFGLLVPRKAGAPSSCPFFPSQRLALAPRFPFTAARAVPLMTIRPGRNVSMRPTSVLLARPARSYHRSVPPISAISATLLLGLCVPSPSGGINFLLTPPTRAPVLRFGHCSVLLCFPGLQPVTQRAFAPPRFVASHSSLPYLDSHRFPAVTFRAHPPSTFFVHVAHPTPKPPLPRLTPPRWLFSITSSMVLPHFRTQQPKSPHRSTRLSS